MGIGAIHSLWYLNLGATAVVIARLLVTGLYRKYPAFAVCLSAALVRGLVFALYLPDPRALNYRLIWVATEPIALILQALMAWEIILGAEAHYRGIGVFARRVLAVCSGLSVIACSLSLGPDINRADWTEPATELLFLLKRSETFILVAVIASTTAFYSIWWAPKSRNSIRHSLIACAYFAAACLTYLGLNLGLSYWVVATTSQAAALACMILWGIVLSPDGEHVAKRTALDPVTTAGIYERFAAMVKAVRAF